MDRLIDRVAMLMSVIAGLVLCFVVALTFYDVLLRYLFSAPLRGRQDLVEMGMVVSRPTLGGSPGTSASICMRRSRSERWKSCGDWR